MGGLVLRDASGAVRSNRSQLYGVLLVIEPYSTALVCRLPYHVIRYRKYKESNS